MGKVNVYLPDDLERAVRDAGLSVSPICQAALQRAVERHVGLRDRGRGPLAPPLDAIVDDLRAEAADAGRDVSVHDLFGAIVRHGDNLGARALELLGVELPARRAGRGRAGTGALAEEAREVLAVAYKVALELRLDRAGPEHVVIAMAMPGSPLADLFQVLGIEPAALRRQIERLAADPATVESTEPADLFTLERLDAAVQALAAELGRLKERGSG
jgi:hypothetical protein